MKLLYAVPAVQHPTMRGALRHYHLLRVLGQRHTITLFALTRTEPTAEALEELGTMTEEFRIFTALRGEVRGSRSARLRQRFAQEIALRRTIREMRQAMRDIVQRQPFDAVLFHGKVLYPLLGELKDLPTVVDFCDATSLRMREQLRHARPREVPWRLLRYHAARRVERRLLGVTPHVVFISARDREAVSGVDSQAAIVPNGIDLDYWTRQTCAPAPERLVFTGVMDYAPNEDAALWMLEEILPRLHRVRPGLELLIVGRDPRSAIIEAGKRNPLVTVTGWVDDIRPYLERSSVFLAPLRYASGLQNKILEAMAMSVPVVTTPIVAAGVRVGQAQPPPLRVAEGAEAISASVLALLEDRAERDRLAARARRFVCEHFDWERSAEQLEALCLKAASAGPSQLAQPRAAAMEVPRGEPGRNADALATLQFLSDAFAALERSGVTFGVLREPSGATTREVDLLVTPPDLSRLTETLTERGFVALPSRRYPFHRFFVSYDAQTGCWWKLDVVTGLQYGNPVPCLRIEETRAVLRRADEDHRLAPQDELLLLLLHCLLDCENFRAHHRARAAFLLRRLRREADPGEVPAPALMRWLTPALTWSEVVLCIENGAWNRLGGRRRAVARQLLRQDLIGTGWRAVAGRGSQLVWPVRSALGQRGPVVSLLGPDGTGKTTLAHALRDQTPLRARCVYLGSNLDAAGLTLPTSRWLGRGRSPSASALARVLKPLRLPNRVFEQWCRYFVARCHQLRGRVVIFDRHPYELQITPRTTVYQRLRAWLLRVGAPTPALVLILDAPPEVLQVRKGEHTVERLEQMRQGYLALGHRLPQALMVDTTVGRQEVRQIAVAAIWALQNGGAGGGTGRDVVGMKTAHVGAPKPVSVSSDAAKTTRRQIRGSSLLLSGRSISMAAKFIVQLLIVRAISTSDFGAWTYALAAVAFLGSFAHLSLDQSVSRFIAIYRQQEQYDRFFGTLLLVAGVAVLMSTAFITSLYAFPEFCRGLVGGESQPLTLLAILIFLVPLNALDQLQTAVFATFGHVRALFLRRYVLAPALQIGVVLLLILSDAGVVFLAYGFLLATVLGIVFSATLLVQLLRREGVLQRFNARAVTLPVRELFSFSMPLVSSDILSALIQATGTMVLGYFYTTKDVAMFRVVLPLAVLNQVAIQSFVLLYIPSAARLFAGDDHHGLNDLHWRTSLWIAVLTFPIFALTFAASTPLTVMFYGERYRAAGVILAILALGNYVQAATGFNGASLKVIGRVRYLVTINVLTAIANVVLTLLLVPRFGAIGAAISVSSTLILHNVLKEIGMHRSGFHVSESGYLRSYGVLGAGIATIVGVRLLGMENLFVLAPLAAAVSLVVLGCTRTSLRIGELFPELRRIPLLRMLQ